jgi:hypothetical protein
MAQWKTLKIDTVTDSGMREQIGGVCVHWALLEMMVELVIANLEGKPNEVTYPDNLSRRLKTLKSLAGKSTLLEQEKAEICEVASQIEAIVDERHRVVHTLWAKDENGVIYSIHPWSKDRKKQGKPLHDEDVRKIKLRIRKLAKRFAPFVPETHEVVLKRLQKPQSKRGTYRQS